VPHYPPDGQLEICLDLEHYYGGSKMKNFFSEHAGVFQVILVILLLVGLPTAVWLDLDNLADANLHHQARDLSSMISSVRAYYSTNVVDRVLASSGPTKVVPDYQSIPGAIPIPATLSLELGKVISEQQHDIKYRFVSDFPF
jgi:adenylate cyclase